VRLLAVHPNFELYGSDRSFANALTAIVERDPSIDVTVLLPRKGPILELPIFSRVRLLFKLMWIPRRGDLSVARIPAFISSGATKILAAAWLMRRFDIVYINTIISLDFILAAALVRTKTFIHVREIPTGREMAVFRALLKLSRATLIFNSKATAKAFGIDNGKVAHVVYNGTAIVASPTKRALLSSGTVRVLVIGRLNAWKGQEIVVAAVALLPETKRAELEIRIVGDVFEDLSHFKTRLAQDIRSAKLGQTISLHPFVDDPSSEYDWADIVIVPSIKPEPFGRVAIEAMSHGAAVIASAHGGLTEIVDNGVTGQLVAPSQPAELAQALSRYLMDRSLIRTHGDAGRRRFLEIFTDEASAKAVTNALAIQ
jgi:glycosyltransferase involved in cell wall biosynthesis